MGWQETREAPCSIARALGVVGERWTLLILREIFRGSGKFDDLRSALGISRNVLSSSDVRRLLQRKDAEIARLNNHNILLQIKCDNLQEEIAELKAQLDTKDSDHLDLKRED